MKDQSENRDKSVSILLEHLRAGDDAAARQEFRQLLARFRDGEESAQRELMNELYAELHRIAEIRMRGERANHTLQATALVNEAYMRIVGSHQPEWEGRTQFLAAASGNMFRVLVDHARRRNAQKKGGDWIRVSLSGDVPGEDLWESDMIDLHRAFERLAETYPRQAQVFELRHIVGLSTKETAEVVGVSERTVKSDTRLALAWLRRELEKGE